MRSQAWIQTVTLGAVLLGAVAGQAEEKKMSQGVSSREQIDERYRWKLEDLYPSQDAWEADFKAVETDLLALGKCQGRLAKSSGGLAGCLDLQFSLSKRYYRLEGYASRLHDQDGAVVKGQELFDRVGKLGTRLAAEIAWVEPEILAIPAKKMAAFGKTKALGKYKHFLDNILRRRAHVLGKNEERIVARAGDMANLPSTGYETLSTLNLPFPEFTTKTGEKVKLNQAQYTRLRTSPDREERVKVFQAFWATYKAFRETYAGLLSGAVNRDHFITQVRGYKSDLESALDGTNVPTAIYTNMIEQVRAGRPLLWRYLKLRKQLLGLDKLAYSDLYPSIVPSVAMAIPFEQAQGTILEALAPLGPEVKAILEEAFANRWIDVYPNAGKRSGAYMSGSAYDVHPYVLLNYVDSFDAMSTTAHELGHAVHSYLANKAQPFHDSSYPTFTAEVASTANENLLRLHLVARETDPQRRLFLLGEYLESWRTTVFRQAIFAEFELKIHDLAQAGQPLTADLLDTTYLALLKEYYGVDQGVVEIDPQVAVEWAYIPHFYYNFYMFQYTTSFIASVAIAERIFSGDAAARDGYLAMLRAGGSLYPVELLKLGGVDMTTAAPYQVAFKSLEKTLAEVEQLATKK
jgi:oligoendopeptidase F